MICIFENQSYFTNIDVKKYTHLYDLWSKQESFVANYDVKVYFSSIL